MSQIKWPHYVSAFKFFKNQSNKEQGKKTKKTFNVFY